MIRDNSKFKKDKLVPKFSEFSITRKTIISNLNLEPDWVLNLDCNPIPYIIKKGNPAEIFILLKSVYGLGYSHSLYRLVESAVFKQQAIHKVANRKYNYKDNPEEELLFYHQLQKIHQLVNLGATDYLNVIKGTA